MPFSRGSSLPRGRFEGRFFNVWATRIPWKWSENEVAQSCPTLCHPVDCSLPGSSIYGIFLARILEWVAISFSRGSSWPRDWTPVSCIGGRCFNLWATREAQIPWGTTKILKVPFLLKLPGSVTVTSKIQIDCHQCISKNGRNEREDNQSLKWKVGICNFLIPIFLELWMILETSIVLTLIQITNACPRISNHILHFMSETFYPEKGVEDQNLQIACSNLAIKYYFYWKG